MDRETIHTYVKEQHRLDAATLAREQETLDTNIESLDPAAFHQRFGELIDRFNQLPLEDKDSPIQSFRIDIPESVEGASDGARLRLLYMDWGFETFIINLDEPTSGHSLREEKLFVDRRAENPPYGVDSLRRLARMEQTMSVVEEELARQAA